MQIPSISDYHTHEDDEYESFLAWMVNIPYHDYRDGKSYSNKMKTPLKVKNNIFRGS